MPEGWNAHADQSEVSITSVPRRGPLLWHLRGVGVFSVPPVNISYVNFRLSSTYIDRQKMVSGFPDLARGSPGMSVAINRLSRRERPRDAAPTPAR